MARDYLFIVGETQYKGTTASAKSQMEAMHIALRTGLMAILDEDKEYSEMGVVGFFGQVAYEDIQKLASLLVEGHVIRREDEVPIAPNLFVDFMEQYYLVIYHALRENLGGFWQLRRPNGGQAAGQQSS